MTKEEFLKNIKIDDKGCWIWQGSKDKNGYGYIHENGIMYRTHRISVSLFLGFDLKSDLFVLHKCDVPSCTNHEHLFIGTQTDNVKDRTNKGRTRTRAVWAQTHCSKCGREYSSENSYFENTGRRKCLFCKRAYARISAKLHRMKLKESQVSVG